jgi:hypothetical protein
MEDMYSFYQRNGWKVKKFAGWKVKNYTFQPANMLT